MQLQKFVGESMPVVLSSLKDALGTDAIILANRRVGDHIEIIATGTLDDASIESAELFQSDDSVESEASEVNETASVGVDTRAPVESNEISDVGQPAETVKSNELDTSNAADHVNGEDESESSDNQDRNATTTLASEQMLSVNTDSIENDDNGKTLTSDANNIAIAELIATHVNGELETRLGHINDKMNKRLSQLDVNLWGEKDPVKSKHLQTLLELGLGAELAVALVNRVDASGTFEDVLRQSLIDLANTLPVASDSTLLRNGVTFITGPSGSGKTTTVLKLAAHKMAISGSDSVVMICADASRIGVFESLAAHGKSMGVSVVCATTQQELEELLQFYSNKELVLVDQSIESDCLPINLPEDDIDDINSRSTRRLLVLPATIQSSVAEEIVSKLSRNYMTRCVITNLDQPCRVGELFTSLIRNNISVAYWSDSSDIQCPLNKASASTLVATAMAMARRLSPTDDERYLMDLIHPRFSASVLPMLSGSL